MREYFPCQPASRRHSGLRSASGSSKPAAGGAIHSSTPPQRCAAIARVSLLSRLGYFVISEIPRALLGKAILCLLCVMGSTGLAAELAQIVTEVADSKDDETLELFLNDLQATIEAAKPQDEFEWRDAVVAWEQRNMEAWQALHARFAALAEVALELIVQRPVAPMPVPPDAPADARTLIATQNDLEARFAEMRRAEWSSDPIKRRDTMLRWEREHATEIETFHQLAKEVQRREEAEAEDIEIAFPIPANASPAEREFILEEAALFQSRVEILNRPNLSAEQLRDALLAWNAEHAERLEAQRQRAETLHAPEINEQQPSVIK